MHVCVHSNENTLGMCSTKIRKESHTNIVQKGVTFRVMPSEKFSPNFTIKA